MRSLSEAEAVEKQAEAIMPEDQIRNLLADPLFSDKRGQDFLIRVRAGAFARLEQPTAIGN